jgi:hypothetical protein
MTMPLDINDEFRRAALISVEPGGAATSCQLKHPRRLKAKLFELVFADRGTSWLQSNYLNMRTHHYPRIPLVQMGPRLTSYILLDPALERAAGFLLAQLLASHFR